jgi:FkbM family methyltransferase
MAQVREPTAYARLLARGLKAYGTSPRLNWRRFTKLAKLARAAHLRRGLSSAQLNADSRFIFPLGDHYWHPVFLGWSYEPGVEWLLRRVKDVPYALIDCGANMGYWSVLATSKDFGAHPAVAIEASGSNFQFLENNAHANGDRFTAIHRAISDVSGKKMKLYGKMHFGRSLNPDWHEGAAAHAEEVETISIDDVAAKFLPSSGQPIVIKLDVEGVEVSAMNGARNTLDAGALLVYEDHEKEKDHPASRHVFQMRDMEVWHLGGKGKNWKVSKIDSLEQAAEAKTRGHDFFAYRRDTLWAKFFKEEAN